MKHKNRFHLVFRARQIYEIDKLFAANQNVKSYDGMIKKKARGRWLCFTKTFKKNEDLHIIIEVGIIAADVLVLYTRA